jgi:ATP adenylyltransferase
MGYVKSRKPSACILCLVRDRSDEVIDLSILRDRLFIASMNLYPYNPGHLLVHPVRHIRTCGSSLGRRRYA